MAEMLTSVLMWPGGRVASQGICLSLQIGQILRTFSFSPATSTIDAILDLSVTTTTILPFGHVT